MRAGAQALSDEELLALLIGSGSPGRSAIALGREVLIAVGGMRGLAHADHTRLRELGLGPATAARVLAAREVGRRAIAAGAFSPGTYAFTGVWYGDVDDDDVSDVELTRTVTVVFDP